MKTEAISVFLRLCIEHEGHSRDVLRKVTVRCGELRGEETRGRFWKEKVKGIRVRVPKNSTKNSVR